MATKNYHHSLSNFFIPKCLLGIIIAVITLAACKKEMSEADDLQSRMSSGMVSYVQGSNVVALNGINYSFTPYYKGVPIGVKERVKSDDLITAVVDPSLVAQYNLIYRETNPAISAEAFTVANKGVFNLTSGSTQTKDSLYVLLNDGSQLKDSTIYLVPVTLSSSNGAKLNYSVFFFKVFVTKGELKAKMSSASIIGGVTAGRLSSGALSLYYTTVPDSVKFRLTLNTQFPANDVRVQGIALTDDEVRAGITKEKFTGVPAPVPVPGAAYNLVKDLTTVTAKSLFSKDSLTLKFPNKALMLKQRWYVMGVKLKTYTGSPFGVPPVANDSARVYIRFFLAN
ncbi:DUF1735 domain-containing protein [Pedobacter sp. Leaf176]|uniref:DUF1735 domain-containing protein n=1 Tax=Pedobacter sp. Leaf176 TaxID=1736286 RepID=UPI0006FE88FB|nr:DUF1735 domain-containing protein [Pedobacter sp. Leaf176]KQR70458.1 hypothetical protein ASF92_10815 [Pedobacter sp. Leaf176]